MRSSHVTRQHVFFLFCFASCDRFNKVTSFDNALGRDQPTKNGCDDGDDDGDEDDDDDDDLNAVNSDDDLWSKINNLHRVFWLRVEHSE
jgi:hypothetical protein